jgi:hypothetical protein
MNSHASGSTAPETKPSLTGGQELTAEDFSKFTEKLMGDQLVRYGMSGVVVVGCPPPGLHIIVGDGRCYSFSENRLL